MVKRNKELKNTPSLSKYLAHAGICSRRKATLLIKSGSIMVNNKPVVDPGTKVNQFDEVTLEGKIIQSVQEKIYILLNKPKDYITTSADQASRRIVIDLVKPVIKQRIYPVGRLDRSSTGLLLLTNDGVVAHALSHPRYHVEKIYHVVLERSLTKHDMEKIKEGVELRDGKIIVDFVDFIPNKSRNNVELILHSGKYRVLRRFFKKIGYTVIKLNRVGYAGLTKKGLRTGAWRYLTEKEILLLKSYTVT